MTSHILVFDRLSTQPVPVKSLRGDFYNLVAGTPITIGDILFTKIESEAKIESTTVKVAPKVGKKAEAIEEDPNQVDFTKLDFRVGRITKVWNHETADRLYCEEIDVGEDVPRAIASGLRQHYTLEEMHDRRVIVVCNLKESKLQGFVSCGMVLAAKTSGEGAESRIVLVDPPTGAAVGDRVYIGGLLEGDLGGGLPLAPSRIKKLKIWEAVAPDLMTDSTGVACWKGRPLLVSGAPVTAVSAPSAPVS